MDKTISISLGGFSFIVDDRAFFQLKNYLDEIRRSLHGMEGTEDILSDVEVRIAELFKERLGIREVVNEHDVAHIIGIMGKPEQFIDEDTEESSKSYSSSSKSSSYSEKVKRKLYRDPNDKIIAGVLSGMAHYIGVDTWVTRLLWIVLFFSDAFISGTSLTIISYIILWIILPKAETATQKYEMYGQAGDFETIKKNASQAASEMKGVARDASSTLGKIFHVIGKIILAFIGIMLICTGIGLIIGAIAILISSSADLPIQFFGYIVDYPWQDYSSKIILFILIFIPATLLIILGAHLISKRVKVSKTFVFSSIGIWFISIIAAALLVGSLFKNFTSNIEFADKKAYTIASDTITLNFDEYKDVGMRKIKWSINNDFGGFVAFDGKLHRKVDDDIEIRQSPNDQVFVEIMYYSKGSSMDNARENAEMISYNYTVNANGELHFDNFYSLPTDAKFRDQDAEIIVYVPKGKVIKTKNIDTLIFFNELENERDYEYGANKMFKIVGNEIICLNCTENDFNSDYNESGKVIEVENLDSSGVNISTKGVNIQDGDEKIIIEKNKLKISDGTDSINIDFSGN